MLMTPALAFFYGGLVRKKNLVSTLSQCLTIFAVVSLVWALWGYSISFAPSVSNFGFIGDLSKVGLNNISPSTINTFYAPEIPEYLYFAFQLKFAAITPALIIGAFAERIKFRSLLIFIVLWSTLIYSPVAHWVWGQDGWLHCLSSSIGYRQTQRSRSKGVQVQQYPLCNSGRESAMVRMVRFQRW